MRLVARALIGSGAALAVGGVCCGFVLDLVALYRELGLVGPVLGVALAPVTLMVEPWYAFFADHYWPPLVATLGGAFGGGGLYGVGHLLAARSGVRPGAAAGQPAARG